MNENITQQRAAQRFAQIQVLEAQLQLKQGELVQAKEHAKMLKEQAEALIDRIRIAARDDGELPLFDMNHL